MRVSEVAPTLSAMWAPPVAGEGKLPQDFRASQLNLVLHMGLDTSAEEARARFLTATEFAQLYPCRIIVLCPMGRERSDRLLDARLFAQCFVGDDLREMCCIEALMLGYPTREAGFLTGQISTWLEGDLPTYHWLNRVPAERINDNHLEFMKMCRRIVIDSAVESYALDAVQWPDASRVSDLAHARMLPVRQSLGQYLSSVSPERLVDGLKGVTILHTENTGAEARQLMRWTLARLEACAQRSGAELNTTTQVVMHSKDALEMRWVYGNEHKFFNWSLEFSRGEAVVEAALGGAASQSTLSAKLLSPGKALSEALFF